MHKTLAEKAKESLPISDAIPCLDGVMTPWDLERTIQRERMQALEQMARGIAHNLGNVLMPIMGLTDLLLTDPSVLNDKEETVSVLKTIMASANDAGDIVQRLREFYRVEQQEAAMPVALRDIVQKAVAVTQPAWEIQAQVAGKSIRLETRLGSIPKVQGNARQLCEVFGALLLNAVAAIRQKGTIRLRLCRKGDWAQVEIDDTGEGMTLEVARRCFEPFFTTRKGQGRGLGLSMCRGIVRQHGGEIAVSSTLGAGTAVVLRLPLAAVRGARKPAMDGMATDAEVTCEI